MKAQTLYRGESKKKDKLTKAEKTYNAVKKWKLRAANHPKKDTNA